MLPAALASQDGLINERYRAPINRLAIADNSASVIRAEMIIPPQVGGFWLREAALYDDDGVCLAVASVPESYKPQLAEGSGRLHALNLWIKVSNTADVKITADLSLVMASAEDVEKAKNEAKDYADKVVGDLETNIQQAIADAVKSAVSNAWELDNPVGTTRFFLVRTSIPMSAGPGLNGCTQEKTKRFASAKLTARTSGKPAAAIPSHSSGAICQLYRLM